LHDDDRPPGAAVVSRHRQLAASFVGVSLDHDTVLRHGQSFAQSAHAVVLGSLQGGMVLAFGVLWWLAVACASKGATWEGKGHREEFEQFTTELEAIAKAKCGLQPFSLRFMDAEQEQRYIANNSMTLCKHLRPLCIGLILVTLYSGTVSETRMGTWQVNPGIGSWSTPSGIVYNCAGFTLLGLCGLMYVVTYRSGFTGSRYIEHLIMSWLFVVVVLLCVFFDRWFVAKMHHQDPEKVFMSYPYDEDYVFIITALAFYLCMHTRLRFIVLMPFCVLLPFIYTALAMFLGSPEASIRTELKTYRGWAAMEINNEIITANTLRLLIIILISLWGKHIMERHQRSSYLHSYHSFQMIQELNGEEDMGESSTAIGKARSSLHKALQCLESLSASPAAAEFSIEKKLLLIREHIDSAQRRMKNAHRLFEVNAQDALRGQSYEGQADLVNFIDANMGGSGEDLCKTATNLKIRSLFKTASINVLQSVDIMEAGVLASEWGDKWSFNALELARATKNAACLFAGERALVDSEHSKVLGVSHECIRSWIRGIHERYLPRSYHNEAHAATVSSMSMFFARQTGWLQKAPALDICALLIAALAHDVGHIGRTNLFCAKAGHSFAMIWNDEAILENMHTATCFAIMRGESNIMEFLDFRSRALLRKGIVSLILATDIKKHHTSLATLQAAMEDGTFLALPEEYDGEQASSKFAQDVAMAGEALIRTSDVGHAMLPWKAHREWSYRVNLEFFEQGDEEEALGLPISPLCSRKACKIASNQAFFIDFLCKDLFVCLSRFSSAGSPGQAAIEECLSLGKENKEHWKEEAEHFDPLTLDMKTLIDRFGDVQKQDIVYPYRFERQKKFTAPVPTQRMLEEIAHYQNSIYGQDHQEAESHQASTSRPVADEVR